MNTIIYLTDNTLEPKIADKCIELLKQEARDIPIISVSHKPMDLGKNICMSGIKRGWIALYKQLLAGLEAAETENVAIVEHDCIYSHEHLSYTPEKKDRLYYNRNHWLVQYDCKTHPEFNGMYSYWPKRCALSQCIGNKEFFKLDTELTLRVLTEPTNDVRIIRAQQFANSGMSYSLNYLIANKLPEHPFEFFSTKTPNLDIRHKSNFTGPKRGKHRTFNLAPWGEFKNIIN